MPNIRKRDINGIYTITNLIDKKIYVGESGGIYSRWWGHRHNLKVGGHHNSHLQRAWDKYGKDLFKFEIIEETLGATKAERLVKEDYWCKQLNTYDERFGYNFDNKNYENGNKKKTPFSKKVPKKVYQVNPEDNHVVSIWSSKQEIASHFNISLRQVNRMIFGSWRGNGGTVKTSRGNAWVMEDSYSPSIDYSELCKSKPRELKVKEPKVYKTRARNNIKSISLQNIETGEIKTFPSHIEAAKELNINKINFYYLNRGFRMKGDKKVNISQWKGWKLYPIGIIFFSNHSTNNMY